MLSFDLTHSVHASDQRWDAFIASLHRVWEFAPDFSLEGHLRLAGRQVLVVDANRLRNQRLVAQLARIGLEATAAEHPRLAWRCLDGLRFDLMVLVADDGAVEAMNFCRGVADDPRHVRLAVIVIGENATHDTIWEWRRAGAKFYLTDPYDPYVLLTLMAAIIDDSRSDDGL
jgi:DNA-binding response OmpR family regulator